MSTVKMSKNLTIKTSKMLRLNTSKMFRLNTSKMFSLNASKISMHKTLFKKLLPTKAFSLFYFHNSLTNRFINSIIEKNKDSVFGIRTGAARWEAQTNPLGSGRLPSKAILNTSKMSTQTGAQV